MTDIEDLRRDITDLFAAADEDLAELADRARQLAAEAFRAPTVAQARQLLNEVGIRTHRSALIVELEQLDEAQTQLREATSFVAAARNGHGDAVAAAEWELAGRFVTRGNKTWLAVDDHGSIPEEEQRSVTADEKKSYLARAVAGVAEVAAAADTLRSAEAAAAEARDAVTLATTSVSARKHVLDSCVAELQVLAVALTAPRKEIT